MKRFCSVLLNDDITLREAYLSNTTGETIIIQAGPTGWEILFENSSSQWSTNDNIDTINFHKAYDTANQHLGPLSKTTLDSYSIEQSKSCVNDNEDVRSVITLIGSSKTKDAFKTIANALTRKGYIVLYPRCYDFDKIDINNKQIYISMHKQMIDMCDFVVVVHDSDDDLTDKTIESFITPQIKRKRCLGETTTELIRYCFDIPKFLIDINLTELLLGVPCSLIGFPY